MKAIEALDKVYYAPLKRNRLVSSSVNSGYQRVETLTWTATQATQGQLAHLKKFPSRNQRVSQRNHIACCLWVWVSLRCAAEAVGQTIYQLKEGLLDDYIRHQLQKPTISINIA